MTALAIAYTGTPDRPWPPHAGGWAPVEADDAAALRGAAAIARTGALAVNTFVDDLVGGEGGGVYRFFGFDTPVGPRVGALRYVGALADWLDRPVSRTGAPGDGTSLPTPGVTLGDLQDASDRLRSYFAANGCTQKAVAEVGVFQETWNAQDPSWALNGPSQINPDAKYGYETRLAVQSVMTSQSLPPDAAPAECFPAGGGGGGGGTSNEPIPGSDAGCSAWAPESNDKATAIAAGIVFHGVPIAWTDQSHYDTMIDGQPWRIVMWQENGMHNAATFRCTKPVATTTTQAGMSGGALFGLASLATAAVVGAVFAFKGGAFG